MQQVASSLWSDEARWECVKMLRILRLKLHGRRISPADFEQLTRKQRKVFRVGRLSEVGVQGMVKLVRFNPHHLDYDWFGPEINQHWWNEDIDGRDWEKTVTRALLHFLEGTLGLAKSTIDPAGWSWRTDQQINGRHWTVLFSDPNMQPQILDGLHKIVLEWDYNNRNEFRTDRPGGADGRTLRFETDMTFKQINTIPQVEPGD